jgi:hypothetical protein
MAVFDAEFRYRIPNTWVELRGEGVWVMFGNPANLRANNDGDPTDNVGMGFRAKWPCTCRWARS